MRYWDYYNVLESDLIACQRYVAFEANNLGVYSLEFMRLLFSVCSEVEVLCKHLCQRIDPTSRRENMTDFRTTIEPALSLSNFQVQDLVRREIFPPFVHWKEKDSPSWWRTYNDVKHDRSAHFKAATLEHSLNALAGLYVLNLYYHHTAVAEAELTPESRLFGPQLKVRKRMIAGVPGYLLPNADRLAPV